MKEFETNHRTMIPWTVSWKHAQVLNLLAPKTQFLKWYLLTLSSPIVLTGWRVLLRYKTVGVSCSYWAEWKIYDAVKFSVASCAELMIHALRRNASYSMWPWLSLSMWRLSVTADSLQERQRRRRFRLRNPGGGTVHGSDRWQHQVARGEQR